MSGVQVELALVALAAMLSPTTLSASTLALVLSDRPKRTGAWFYLGALGAEPLVRRNDAVSCDDVLAMSPAAIVISPGPGVPAAAGIASPRCRHAGSPGRRPRVRLGNCCCHLELIQ